MNRHRPTVVFTYLSRAVDDEGEVLEVLVQSRRNKRAAVNLMRKLLRKRGNIPDQTITDKLGSYSAALRDLGVSHIHVTGGRLNNRAEVSHGFLKAPTIAWAQYRFDLQPISKL